MLDLGGRGQLCYTRPSDRRIFLPKCRTPLTQYNSQSKQWSTAVRFRYTYMPGSDLYIVYDEVRRDAIGLTEIQDRQLILKLTYLLSR